MEDFCPKQMEAKEKPVSTLPFPEERILKQAIVPRLVQDCNDLGLALSLYGRHCKKVFDNAHSFAVDTFEDSDSWRKDFADEHLVFYYAFGFGSSMAKEQVLHLCDHRKQVNLSQGQRVAVLLIEKELNMIFALFGEDND